MTWLRRQAPFGVATHAELKADKGDLGLVALRRAFAVQRGIVLAHLPRLNLCVRYLPPPLLLIPNPNRQYGHQSLNLP